MNPEKQFITTNVIKKNIIKLPSELANHPRLSEAKVDMNEDIVTFILPIDSSDPNEAFGEIWQYIHRKQSWVVATFTK